MRSGFFLFGISLSSLLVLACQNSSPQPALPFAPPPVRPTNGPTRSYLNLTPEQARAKAEQMGLRSRVVRRDQEQFIITKDFRSDRINFEIDKGRVTLAKIF